MRSLHELYHRHKGAVFGYLWRMTGSTDEADELTQETFYQAVLSIHRFRGEASVKTWLLKIARNLFLKRLRQRQREEGLLDPEAALEQAVDPEAGPLQRLVLQDEREALNRALARLPEQYRTALILREVQELSTAEVAAILDKSEATVRVLLHRARQRLHQLYQREEEPGQ